MNEIREMKAYIGAIAVARHQATIRVKNIATRIKQDRQNSRVESARHFAPAPSSNHGPNVL